MTQNSVSNSSSFDPKFQYPTTTDNPSNPSLKHDNVNLHLRIVSLLRMRQTNMIL